MKYTSAPEAGQPVVVAFALTEECCQHCYEICTSCERIVPYILQSFVQETWLGLPGIGPINVSTAGR